MDHATQPANDSRRALPFGRGSVELAFGTLPAEPVQLQATPAQIITALTVMALAGAVADMAFMGGSLSLSAIARMALVNFALIAPAFFLVRLIRFQATDARQASIAMVMLLWPVSGLAATLIAITGAGQVGAGALLGFAMVWVIARMARITPYLPQRGAT